LEDFGLRPLQPVHASGGAFAVDAVSVGGRQPSNTNQGWGVWDGT